MKRATCLSVLLLAALTCTTQPMDANRERCAEHPLFAALAASGGRTLGVVVTLRPAEGVAPAALQRRLLAELQDAEHTVLRRSDNFPIITLAVGEEAFCRVVTSDLVESVERDSPEPTTP